MELTYPIQIVGPYTCRNAGRASINNSDTFVFISTVFQTQTSALTKAFVLAQTLVLAFILTPTPVSGLPEIYTNKNL